jgi:hypothetical protein
LIERGRYWPRSVGETLVPLILGATMHAEGEEFEAIAYPVV